MAHRKRNDIANSSSILLNSIPKAGTNLMDSLLQEFPGLCPKAGRTLMEWGLTSNKTVNKVLSIKNGFYQTAHLPSHKNLINAVGQSDLKIIMIIRDPRDVVISNYKYVLGIDVTHKSHKFISELKNDKERIKSCILGEKGIISPIHEIYKEYSGWLNQKNCLVVRFEDLVGNRGGSTDLIQRTSVLKIADFLGVQLSDMEFEEIINKMKNPDTPTFRMGKIGGWKNYFDDDLLLVFNSHMGDVMKEYGYR